MNMLPTESEMFALINKELDDMTPECKEYAASKIVSLKEKVLRWEYGNNEPFPAWEFANFGSDDLCAVYCLGGHGADGFPWGLVHRNDDYFGMACSWYESFEAMLSDGLYG